MASEKDFELLDEYIGNRLNAQDKISFEQKLAVDTELKREFLLQQKIIAGIRQARVAELKQMLNNIPLSSIPNNGTSMLTQIGIWVAAAGIVGTGLYFYFKPDNNPPVQQPIFDEVVEETSPQIIEPGLEEPVQQEKVVPVEADIPAKTKKKITVPEASPSPANKVEEKAVDRPKLDVFDPTTEIENTAADDAKGNETVPATTPSIVVETISDKQYDFHYQFKNSKLYLYGSFEKNLYEIMEFFSDNKRTMFLFYKDNYYLLNEETEKVKALTPINDATLLKKLKDYRSN
ncbi:MAG: hypothetical protein OEW40_19680 [Cyclobacteriaceae bacterium]|nr:hypothetical protein [Cyclobacteriaceae bacterium]